MANIRLVIHEPQDPPLNTQWPTRPRLSLPDLVIIALVDERHGVELFTVGPHPSFCAIDVLTLQVLAGNLKVTTPVTVFFPAVYNFNP